MPGKHKRGSGGGEAGDRELKKSRFVGVSRAPSGKWRGRVGKFQRTFDDEMTAAHAVAKERAAAKERAPPRAAQASRFTGVTAAANGNWHVTVYSGGRTFSIGTFDDE